MASAGFNWSAPPRKLPVPAVANCIVAFHPGRAALNSAAERKLLSRWQRHIGATAPEVAALSGPVPVKAHKGVCCSRWVNPDRPWQLAAPPPAAKRQTRRAPGTSSSNPSGGGGGSPVGAS